MTSAFVFGRTDCDTQSGSKGISKANLFFRIWETAEMRSAHDSLSDSSLILSSLIEALPFEIVAGKIYHIPSAVCQTTLPVISIEIKALVIFKIEDALSASAFALFQSISLKNSLLRRQSGIGFAKSPVVERSDMTSKLMLGKKCLPALDVSTRNSGIGLGRPTCSSPACLLAVGRPVTPLSFRPPTSCFSCGMS